MLGGCGGRVISGPKSVSDSVFARVFLCLCLCLCLILARHSSLLLPRGRAGLCLPGPAGPWRRRGRRLIDEDRSCAVMAAV